MAIWTIFPGEFLPGKTIMGFGGQPPKFLCQYFIT